MAAFPTTRRQRSSVRKALRINTPDQLCSQNEQGDTCPGSLCRLSEDALQIPAGKSFWSILSSSAETFHPHKPQSCSRIINSYFPVSLYPGTHTAQSKANALLLLWSLTDHTPVSQALHYSIYKKKGDSMKPSTLLKAFLFFPGAKESVMCQGKPKAVRATSEAKAQCWLWHWQFSPALGKSPRNFCGYCPFLMSLMLRMPFSLRVQSAVFLAWLCSGLHHCKAVNGLNISPSSSAKWG